MRYRVLLAVTVLGAAGFAACGGSASDGAADGSAGSAGNASGGTGAGTSTGGSGGSTGGTGGGGPGTGGSATGGSGGGGGTTPGEPENHRSTAMTCPGGPGTMNPPGPDAGAFGCMLDSDCTEGLNGRCVFGRFAMCSYDECFDDNDCPNDTLCQCGSPDGLGNRCMTAGCRTDADCPGSWCSPTFGSCGAYGGIIAYQCHTPRDECLDDSDCGGGRQSQSYCAFDPTAGHWVCDDAFCVG